MIRSGVSSPPWEFERHRRGAIRWYPFDSLLNIGANSAGSTATLIAPGVRLATGALSATPQNKSREMCEKLAATTLWTGIDTLDYWSRSHHLQCFVTIDAGNITPIGGFAMTYIGLMMPGLPVGTPNWNANPGQPFAILRYQREGVNAASPNEHFDLVTAYGDGVQAVVVTPLAGVQGPRSNITAGNARTQRWEIVYEPGAYVAALIDGVEGARVTTTLSIPNPAAIPGGASNLAGCGVAIYQGNIGDQQFSTFHSMMGEGYRV